VERDPVKFQIWPLSRVYALPITSYLKFSHRFFPGRVPDNAGKLGQLGRVLGNLYPQYYMQDDHRQCDQLISDNNSGVNKTTAPVTWLLPAWEIPLFDW
jgi:hypothetical protein